MKNQPPLPDLACTKEEISLNGMKHPSQKNGTSPKGKIGPTKEDSASK
jgi:hypothetical protein